MSKSERETWTQEMDNSLVDAFLNQLNMGNKVGVSFTSKAYKAITNELQEKFQRSFAKEKVKSRWKLIKRSFSKCYDVFKSGLSGFAWDPVTKHWCAEPEVWQKLIETKPEVEEWMKKPIPNYDKMMLLCGEDRATGEHAETAKEIRNKRAVSGESKSLETSEFNLDSVQDTVGNEVTSPEVTVSRSQGPKGKRPRTSRDEIEAEGIKIVLQDLVGAFRESTAAYERAKQKAPIPESEVWKMLENLQIEDHLINKVYMYLLGHPECIRGVIGCPQDRRKKLLFEMVFGPGGP